MTPLTRLTSLRWSCVVGIVLCASIGCDMRLASTDRAEARRLATRLQGDLIRTVDAGNAAVMSDEKDAASASAQEARDALRAASSGAQALYDLLMRMRLDDEATRLAGVRERLADYASLETEILDLAMEGSNMRGQRLAFGPAAEQADTAIAEVSRLVTTSTDARGWRRRALVNQFAASIREIQSLQPPHIAAARDDAMTTLEARMHTAEQLAAQAMGQLTSLEGHDARGVLEAGRMSFEQFLATNQEIVRLSRRNSDVRSLALTLGKRRVITAQLFDDVQRIQDDLARHDDTGTR